MERISRSELLAASLDIAEGYGGNLTVRQLYYRLVATGRIASSQKEYKRIVATLSKARLDGDFPLDWLLDRTRSVGSGSFTYNSDDVDVALEASGDVVRGLPEEMLGRARWMGQKTHISVWVEKEALAGVFEAPCAALGVGMFACKGYPSLSSLYQWVLQTARALYANDGGMHRVRILYFGDHDPDGFEIPRSAVRNVNRIVDLTNSILPVVQLDRVALNMDQILEFNPPPFPAKLTSARYNSYIAEHDTDDAWELDALDPPDLDRMIRDEIAEWFDVYVHQDNIDLIEGVRDEMRERMQDEAWLRGVLNP